jgi:Domain of unknown function (DUF4383)
MTERSTAQTLAMLFGAVFLAVGILGFIPGITTNYDELKFAGNESQAELFGLFQVSILHNIVHVLFGISGLALARTWEGAQTYLLGAGLIYVALVVYGILVDPESDANFVPLNDADAWLHGVLAVGLLVGWYVGRRGRDVASRPTTTTST